MEAIIQEVKFHWLKWKLRKSATRHAVNAVLRKR